MKKTTKVAIIITISVIVLLIAALAAVSAWGYNQNFGHRVEYEAEENEKIFEDLLGVKRESVSFQTSNNVTLSGYIYNSTTAVKPKATIVFVHGFGGTHQWEPYIKETEYLVNNGYSVFSYDNTGCGISSGKSMVGLTQSVIDLDHALTFIEKEQDLPIMLYGHSWGGYTVSAILNTDHKITAVAERSGFNSGKEIVFERGKGMVGNLMYATAPFTSAYELIKFGKYSKYTGVGGINHANIPVLIMHSKDDVEVPYDLSIAAAASSITNEKAQIKIYEDKGHNVTVIFDEQGIRQVDTIIMDEIVAFFSSALNVE